VLGICSRAQTPLETGLPIEEARREAEPPLRRAERPGPAGLGVAYREAEALVRGTWCSFGFLVLHDPPSRTGPYCVRVAAGWAWPSKVIHRDNRLVASAVARRGSGPAAPAGGTGAAPDEGRSPAGPGW